jgi:hypothetical protein
LGTSRHQGGKRKHAPYPDRTLEQSPEHLQKVIGGALCPVKETGADAKSKTSLRLMKNWARQAEKPKPFGSAKTQLRIAAARKCPRMPRPLESRDIFQWLSAR